MTKILLICSAGMSTSLLVVKMEKAAKDQGLDTQIWSVPIEAADNNIPGADVVLLGPQVRYLLAKMREIAKPYGIPVESIPFIDYGMCDGPKVLKLALKLLNT